MRCEDGLLLDDVPMASSAFSGIWWSASAEGVSADADSICTSMVFGGGGSASVSETLLTTHSEMCVDVGWLGFFFS